MMRKLEKALTSLPAITRGDVVMFAIWIGIVGGLSEVARAIWRKSIRHFPTGQFTAGEVVWTTPLSAVVTLVAIALLLILVDRAVRARGVLLRLGPPLFAGLALYSLLRGMRIGMTNLAALVLALGFATLVLRIIAARPVFVRRLVWRTTPWLVAALVVWAAIVPVSRRIAAARVIATLPEPASGAMNVLVIIWDTARAVSLSLYGYERETTPELDRFAQRGAIFDRAFATAPWSLPSHASMYTGRLPPEMTAARQVPLDDTFPTLAEVLADNGYATAGFTANIYYGSQTFGIARGFSWYDDRPVVTPRLVAQSWWLAGRWMWELRERGTEYAAGPMRPRASQVNRALLRWIDRRGERPFFAVINHFDAHDPYFPPPPFNLAFSNVQPHFWLDEEHPTYSKETLRQLKDAYDGAIRYLDHELGLLLNALRDRGVLDNTLVIVTSDHGEEFGEHSPDLVKHARSLYAPALHVPLVVVAPSRVPAGVRRSEPVSIRDIPATVMDVLGRSADSPFPGTSLVRYANGTVTPEEIAEPRLSVAEHSPMGGVLPTWPIAAGDMFSLVAGDLHYIVDGKGREQLFDLANDIMAQRDLAESAEAAPHLARFRVLLDSIVPAVDGVRRAYAPRRPN